MVFAIWNPLSHTLLKIPHPSEIMLKLSSMVCEALPASPPVFWCGWLTLLVVGVFCFFRLFFVLVVVLFWFWVWGGVGVLAGEEGGFFSP